MADDWNASNGKENSTRHVSYFHWRLWFGYLISKNGRHSWEVVGWTAMHRKQNLNSFVNPVFDLCSEYRRFPLSQKLETRLNHKHDIRPRIFYPVLNIRRAIMSLLRN